MFVKAVLLVVFAAVAVQCDVPYDVEEDAAHVDDNDAKLIHSLKETIEKSVKVEKEALHKLHKEISKKVKEGIKEEKSKFQKEIKESVKEIKKLEKQAEKQKVDVKACLTQEKELKHLSKEFHKKVAACESAILAKSKAVTTEEKKEVKEALKAVKTLKAELKACGKTAESAKCKAKVATEVAEAAKQEPAKIKKTVDEAVPAILKLVPAAEQCAKKEAVEFTTEGVKIAKDIQACINKKLH